MKKLEVPLKFLNNLFYTFFIVFKGFFLIILPEKSWSYHFCEKSLHASNDRLTSLFGTQKGVKIIQVTSKNNKKSKTQFKPLTTIFPKNEIVTDSETKIIFSGFNETIFTLYPNSQVIINKYNYGSSDSQIELSLIKGFLHIKSKDVFKDEKKFRIKTVNAVAGIRGTEFTISFNSIEKITTVFTISGLVWVEKSTIPSQLLILKANDQITIK